MTAGIKLRALEKEDLPFIHKLNNNRSIMNYWFEEPYESFDELQDLYNEHIHDNSERRFIAINEDREPIGLVELIEIDYLHRNTEFTIIISPEHQGNGYARALIHSAMDYAFSILNLHKVYLHVALENEKATHLYKTCGFIEEGHLVQEIFTSGRYSDVLRMYILQEHFLADIA